MQHFFALFNRKSPGSADVLVRKRPGSADVLIRKKTWER